LKSSNSETSRFDVEDQSTIFVMVEYLKYSFFNLDIAAKRHKKHKNKIPELII
jgi:hypothetical protein